MERKIVISSNRPGTLAVNDECGLRLLSPFVRRAYLDGGAMSRHENPDRSIGGWLPEDAETGANVHLGVTAVILGSKGIGDNVSVGNETTIRDSEIKDCVRIGNGVYINDSVLSGKNDIGNDVVVGSSVLGYGSCVGDRSLVGMSEARDRVLIGSGVSMRKSILLGNNNIGEGSTLIDSIVFAGMEIGPYSVIDHSRIELTKARAIPAESFISGDIVHSDLDVVHMDVLPIRQVGNIDDRLDEALGIMRK